MFRSRDQLFVPGSIHMNYMGTSYYSFPTNARCIGSFESIDSVDTGNFTPGVFRVNPVTIRKCVGSVTNGTLAFKNTNPMQPCGNIQIASGPFMAAHQGQPTASWDASRASVALAKAFAKTKDADVEMFVMAGELKETITLLKNPVKALLAAFITARKMNLFKRVADGAAGGWLTWFYGVMPLISDISSIIELANKQHGQLGGLMCKRSSVTTGSTTTNISQGSFWSFQFDVSKVTKSESKYTAVVYYTLKPSHTSVWDSRVLGFAWNQLPRNLWELVTLSFVVDWVYDVGSWLSNIMPDPSVTYLGNCVSCKSTVEYTAKMSRPRYCTTYTPTGFLPSTFTWTENKLERRVNLSLPALPVLNRDFLSLRRLISSIALIWANVPRLVQRR